MNGSTHLRSLRSIGLWVHPRVCLSVCLFFCLCVTSTKSIWRTNCQFIFLPFFVFVYQTKNSSLSCSHVISIVIFVSVSFHPSNRSIHVLFHLAILCVFLSILCSFVYSHFFHSVCPYVFVYFTVCVSAPGVCFSSGLFVCQFTFLLIHQFTFLYFFFLLVYILF